MCIKSSLRSGRSLLSRYGLCLVLTSGLGVAQSGCSDPETQPTPMGAVTNTAAGGPVTTGAGAVTTGMPTVGGATSAGVGTTATAGGTVGGGTTGTNSGTTMAAGSVTSTGSVGGFTATATAAGTQTSAGGSGTMSSGATGTTGGNCSLEEERFSFFLTSQAALIRESGNEDGFGGNLGGITGADQICQTIAEFSTPCAASKQWRAFLSTTTEDAIDRIGQGPWYDRLGRLLANGTSELVTDGDEDERTLPNADPMIRNDLPNEDGVPNHAPDGTEVDNHQTVTGTGKNGRLYTQDSTGGGFGGTACNDGDWTPEKATCWDWTSAEEAGCPRVGHSWPRQGSGINWISVWNEGGCAPGGTIEELGGPDGSPTIGSAGGYGGFYCFALTGQ